MNGTHTHPLFSRPRGRHRGRVSPAPHAGLATSAQQAQGKSVACASNINRAGNDPALSTPST